MSPQPPQIRFRYPKRMRFAEVDAQTVLHNARYFEYFKIGSQEYVRAAEIDEKVDPCRDINFHVVKVEHL